MPNLLSNEVSPYLLQHKDNPINWYPWNDEALNKAKNENKQITVGYLYNFFDVDNVPQINDIINYNFDIIGNNAFQYFKDCVWTFCEYYLKEKQKILNDQYKDERFAAERKDILIKIQKINTQLKNKNLEEDLWEIK